MLTRRGLLLGLAASLAAPALVRAASLDGIPSTSLLYKIVTLEAVLFSGLFTGYAITRGFPVGDRPDGRWIAGAAAGAIAGLYILFAGIFGKLPIGF